MGKLRLAFLGFRHGHVMGLYNAARKHPRVEVAAACEEDAATAASLKSAGSVELTHATYDDVWNGPPVDAVAVGDYFARRGSIILDALKRQKHVIADKPVATDIAELETMRQLTAGKRLRLGCLLDLRDHGNFITMRRLIRDKNAIGEVHTITFTAQHPLMLGKRPTWYFEPGKHGGTINDIGIHAIDLIPWLTGRRITECTAARAWNARVPEYPQFQDAGQVMLELDNGGGVLGDVSYLTPDAAGYGAAQYWRVTVHGDRGVVETSYNTKTVDLAADKIESVASEAGDPTGCLDAFLDEIDGAAPRRPDALTTADVLDASRRALLIQHAADHQKTNFALE
jgi:predicted dehydrogenase